MNNQTHTYERLTSENAALVLVDHQLGLMTGVRDYSTGELKHNVVALAKPAKALKHPSIVTTTALDKDWPWLYYSDMNHAVATALIHAAQRVEERLEEVLAGVGLSCAKFGALGVLVGQDQPISLSELAEKLTCVRSNVTQLVDRLEADGLVKRIDHPADRRAVQAEVTALGRERHATGATVVNAVLQDVANKLAAVDSQKLKRALDAIQ